MCHISLQLRLNNFFFYISVLDTKAIFTDDYKYVNYKEISNDSSTNAELSYNTHAPRSVLVCDLFASALDSVSPPPSNHRTDAINTQLRKSRDLSPARRHPIALCLNVDHNILKTSQQIMRELVLESERDNYSGRLYEIHFHTASTACTPPFTCHSSEHCYFLLF